MVESRRTSQHEVEENNAGELHRSKHMHNCQVRRRQSQRLLPEGLTEKTEKEQIVADWER